MHPVASKLSAGLLTTNAIGRRGLADEIDATYLIWAEELLRIRTSKVWTGFSGREADTEYQ